MECKLTVYHACRYVPDLESIRSEVPFISKAEGQWLTQGYYFWTDTPTHAKTWRCGSGNKNIISEFTLTFKKENLLLDLVGNVKHQELFDGYIELLEGKGVFQGVGEKITISQVIFYLRKQEHEDIFPFIAIKAGDKHKSPYIFHESSKYRERCCFITRQQLCLFDKKHCDIELNLINIYSNEIPS